MPGSAEPVDRLAESYAAMQQGISLEPSAPRIRDLILSGYREILATAMYLGNEAECSHIRSQIVALGGDPTCVA